jgi:hypothetical protein
MSKERSGRIKGERKGYREQKRMFKERTGRDKNRKKRM